LLKVQDDGKGVAEQTLRLQPGSIGIGLGGMRERVGEFGGELRISNANPGTIVEISIPGVMPASQLTYAAV
jgi:signal transduction histidine kinase